MTARNAARVAVIGLASDFGCQLQMTNIEDHLLDVVGQFELAYWQLASSGEMPEEYDILVVEGAVTTEAHILTLKEGRKRAKTIITVGACAMTGGLPGLVSVGDFETAVSTVYGTDIPVFAAGRVSPMPVHSVVKVDYEVPGCPIEPAEFVKVLQHALAGIRDTVPAQTMCGSCRINETECFFDRGDVCLGLITAAGCGARCVAKNRPCKGCRGLAADANLEYASKVLGIKGLNPEDMDNAIELFNACREALHE